MAKAVAPDRPHLGIKALAMAADDKDIARFGHGRQRGAGVSPLEVRFNRNLVSAELREARRVFDDALPVGGGTPCVVSQLGVGRQAVNDNDAAAAQTGFIGRPSQRRLGRRGPVVADDDPPVAPIGVKG
jgi:hypothetical protein